MVVARESAAGNLRLALLLSVVVHVLALAMGRTPPVLPELPPLQLVLPQPASPVAKPTAVAAAMPAKPLVKPAPHAPPAQHEPVLALPASVPKPLAQPVAVSPAPVVKVAESAPTASTPSTAPVTTAAVSDKVASPARPVVAESSEALDADGVRRFRLALSGAMRHYKQYPRLARERGWQGDVELRIVMHADGRPIRVQLGRSSGHAILDDQARDMLEKALADTPLPPHLRGKDFSLPLAVAFNLEDE